MRSAEAPPAPTIAQTAFLQCLSVACGGEVSAKAFLQAALRSARRSALPTEPEEILDFARAHLLAALTEELGARTALTFLDEALRLLRSREGPTSSSRLRASLAPPVPDGAPAFNHELEVPASSRWGRGGAGHHLRVVLAHGDRLQRATLARVLVASGCEVLLVEAFVDIAAMSGTLPAIAVVDLGAQNVDVLLAGLVTRNPQVRVLGIHAADCDAETTFRRAKVATFTTVQANTRGATLVERLRELAAR